MFPPKKDSTSKTPPTSAKKDDAAPAKGAKASPSAPKFSSAQQGEDTERDLMGKPQKFGAAMGDDADAGAPPDAGGDAAPDAAGLAPTGPSDPMDTDIPAEGDNDDKAAQDQGDTLAALQSQNADLSSRLSAIEQKLGIPGQAEPGGEAMAGPGKPFDPETGEDIY